MISSIMILTSIEQEMHAGDLLEMRLETPSCNFIG